MGRQHAVLNVHARIEGKLVDLAQDDGLVGGLLCVLAHDHRPTGVQRRVKIIVAAMDIQGVLGQSARAYFQDHGREFARRVVILFHGVGDALAGSEIDGAAPGDGKGGGASLGGVLAFGFDRDFLLAPNIEVALRVGALVNLAAFGGGSDGIENAPFGDADFDVLGDQRVPVAGDADAGILWPGMLRLEFLNALLLGKG